MRRDSAPPAVTVISPLETSLPGSDGVRCRYRAYIAAELFAVETGIQPARRQIRWAWGAAAPWSRRPEGVTGPPSEDRPARVRSAQQDYGGGRANPRLVEKPALHPVARVGAPPPKAEPVMRHAGCGFYVGAQAGS